MAKENRWNRFASLMIMLGVPLEMAACSAAVTGTNNNETALVVSVGIGAAMIGLGIISALVGRDAQTETITTEKKPAETEPKKNIKTKEVKVPKPSQPEIRRTDYDVDPLEDARQRKN